MDVILKPRILISVLECLHDRSADDETARDHVGQVKRDFTRTRADRVETRHGLVIGRTKFITGKEFNDPEKFLYSVTSDRKFGVMAALSPPRLRLPRIPSWKQIQMRPLRSADACRQGSQLESALSSGKPEKPIPSRLRCTAFTERCPPDEENRPLRSDFQPRAWCRQRPYKLLPSRRTLREPPPRRHYAVPWQ